LTVAIGQKPVVSRFQDSWFYIWKKTTSYLHLRLDTPEFYGPKNCHLRLDVHLSDHIDSPRMDRPERFFQI
jgi:hypothetical protein